MKVNSEKNEKPIETKKENCSHTKKFTYNHGYHTVCLDCGEEL